MIHTDDQTEAIAAIRGAIESAENAGDADAAAAFFSEDAVLMVPDFPVQEGKAACTCFMRDIMSWSKSQLERHITYTSAEVTVIDNLAFDRGTFSFTAEPRTGGDTIHVTGKYFWLLRRTAAEPWKIARLIVSRDDESGAEGHESGDFQ